MKKLIPAIVMLLVSAVVLSTASYAWFTTAQDVTAGGMQVTATAPTSVLIDGLKANGQYTGEFTSSVQFDQVAAKLYAASSANGKDFFYADKCTDTTGAMSYESAIKAVTTNDGDTKYYVDYKLKLKNTSADNDVKIVLEGINVEGPAIASAVRIAIITEDGSFVYNPAKNYDTDLVDGYVKVATSETALGNAAQGPLYIACEAEHSDWATYAAGQKADDVYKDNTQVIITLGQVTHDAQGVEVDNSEEITVRIWFEGQSAACVSKNAGLSATVDLVFGMVNEAGNS